MAVDATINPDFSQIESDVAVISRIDPPELPLDHAVFLLWFELLLSRRSAAATAAV